MALDLILRNARLARAGPEQPTVDIGVQHGRIVAIEPHLTAEGPAYDAGGKLVSPGLIESHFHLDKTRLIDRVLGDKGHLSNEQAAELLRAIVARSRPGRLRHLIQLHISQQCNTPELAMKAARTVVEGNVAIHTARQDLPLPFLRLDVGSPRPTGEQPVAAE